jgi:hypothetical protein
MSVGVLVGAWLLAGVLIGLEWFDRRRTNMAIDKFRHRFERLTSREATIHAEVVDVRQNEIVAPVTREHDEWDDLIADTAPEHWDRPLDPRATRSAASTRASAYAHIPSEQRSPVMVPAVTADDSPFQRERMEFGHPEMRRRRRRMFLRLGGTALVSSLFSLMTSWVIFTLVAVLSWIALAAFVGLVYRTMMDLGLAEETTVTPRLRLLTTDEQTESDYLDDAEPEQWVAEPRRAAGY